MDINFFIKHAPQIIENQVKTALIKVAKDNNIPDATQMDVLVHYSQGRILFIPHYNHKEVARIPLSTLITGEIGNALLTLMLKIWRNESQRYAIAVELVNFMMHLQTNGVVLVWPYHQGQYGEQISIQQFLSL